MQRILSTGKLRRIFRNRRLQVSQLSAGQCEKARSPRYASEYSHFPNPVHLLNPASPCAAPPGTERCLSRIQRRHTADPPRWNHDSRARTRVHALLTVAVSSIGNSNEQGIFNAIYVHDYRIRSRRKFMDAAGQVRYDTVYFVRINGNLCGIFRDIEKVILDNGIVVTAGHSEFLHTIVGP
jgi:hypothetical protein